jgi:hypothetical protein
MFRHLANYTIIFTFGLMENVMPKEPKTNEELNAIVKKLLTSLDGLYSYEVNAVIRMLQSEVHNNTYLNVPK